MNDDDTTSKFELGASEYQSGTVKCFLQPVMWTDGT